MTDLDALRLAVLAAPDDDLPRLVYADCLEENGDPDRAAFIRAQIELARQPEYEPFPVMCHTRRPEWVTGEPWVRDLPDCGGALWPAAPFRRGFGWAIAASHLPAIQHAIPRLLASEPLCELHLSTATLEQWRLFAASPWLPRIHSIVLGGLTSPNEPLRELRQSPHTTGVRKLRLEHTNVPSLSVILEDLFATSLGLQLTSLSMQLGYGSVDETLEAIAQNGPVSLTEWDLYHMGFGPSAARVFADSGLARQTQVLRLPGNPLMLAGVAILATAADNFRILDLTETRLDAKASELLAQSPNFRSLRKLVLAGNKLGTDAIKAITRSQHLTGLRSLSLVNTHCGDAAVRYITRGTIWPNLVELDLRNNPISDTGGSHLLTARSPSDLTNLGLPRRNLSGSMRERLVAKFGDAVSFAE